jgi:NAD(P) transhydrogenase subunit alpha
MDVQSGMTGLLAVHIVMLSAFAGWMIVGRAPSILHEPLTSGCALLGSIVTVAGLCTLLSASTRLEQIAGFCAVLLGAADAAGEYGVGARHFALFRAPLPAVMSADGEAAKPGAARRERPKRGPAKPRRRAKKVLGAP